MHLTPAGEATAPGGARPPAPDAQRPPGAALPATAVQALTADEALRVLGSGRRGLPGGEAAARLREYGANLLPRPRARSVAAELIAQLRNMFAVVLLIAAALTFGIYLLGSPRSLGNLELSVGILGVVVLNALIGFFQEHSAERTAEALQAMVPHRARVLRDGEISDIPAEEVVPGDLLALEAGDAVAADCRIVESHDLRIEMAAITGESEPVRRVAEPVGAVAVTEARNCAFMGTSVTDGNGKAVVFATGLGTEFGRIYRLTEQLPPEPSPLQRQVADMARRVAAVAILAGGALFGLRLLTGNAVGLSFVFALGVMVALVPEGLPATLSVSLAIGVRRMARRQALIKRLNAVEALGSTSVICTDKTGTLTQAEMTVQAVYRSGRVHAVSGVGYAPNGTVDDAAAVRDVLVTAALCCDARLVAPDGGAGWRVIGDTTEGAILVAARKAGIDPAAVASDRPRVGVFPFSPDRKRMTTLQRSDGGYEACVKGSPEAVLERCSTAEWEGGEVPLAGAVRGRISAATDALAAGGMRVLGVARRPLETDRMTEDEVESGLVFLGLIAMSDPPRPDVSAAIAACHTAGIRVIMVTGDYGLTAEAVARRIGILTAGPAHVVTGNDLDAMTDAGVAECLRQEQLVFARARPEHKLRVVAALEAENQIVAVTGDGANDAPALKRASVGVAMGVTGTDVARSAAVMVLLDDSFASIEKAIELGRSVYQNIRRFLIYLFSHNLAELSPILVAAFVGFPLVPLSALQVLAIDLGSDVLPALALGAEPPEPGTMDRPPRPSSEHLFNWAVVRRFLFLGSIQSAGVVFAFFWKIHTAHIPLHSFTSANPVYREALTMSQAGIIVSQFFNSFSVRTDRQSVFKVGLLSNPALVVAGLLGVGFMCAISYAGPLQAVFHTAPLSVGDWLLLIAFGAVLLLADEGRKAWHRRSDGAGHRRVG